MKKVMNGNVKSVLLLYFALYTIATITNSILYLAQGVFEDPSGNWHELDRAVIVMVAVIAYALIRFIKVKNYGVKLLTVYVPTMLLVFLYVFLRGLTVELAKSAYKDIFNGEKLIMNRSYKKEFYDRLAKAQGGKGK